jgi:hypothetical protein
MFVNLAYMTVGMIFMLLGVTLGAFVVFRVKLPQEKLFQMTKPKGSVTYADPFTPEPKVDGGAEIITRLQKKANAQVLKQMDNMPLESIK